MALRCCSIERQGRLTIVTTARESIWGLAQVRKNRKRGSRDANLKGKRRWTAEEIAHGLLFEL